MEGDRSVNTASKKITLDDLEDDLQENVNEMETSVSTEEPAAKTEETVDRTSVEETLPDDVSENVPSKDACKSSRFYESYITLLAKTSTVCDGLTSDCKSQLNGLACVLTNELVRVSSNMASGAGRKTITLNDTISAVKFLLTGKLLTGALDRGNKATVSFSDKSRKDIRSKNKRASIIFPVSLVEKFYREQCSMLISSLVPVYTAGVVEYLMDEVIEAGCGASSRKRLRVQEVSQGVAANPELRSLISSVGVEFVDLSASGEEPPDYLSIRSNKLRLAKLKVKPNKSCVTDRAFNDILKMVDPTMKYNADTKELLQTILEDSIINLMYRANLIAQYSGRVRVSPNDVDLACVLANT
jgi:histone H3/H4